MDRSQQPRGCLDSDSQEHVAPATRQPPATPRVLRGPRATLRLQGPLKDENSPSSGEWQQGASSDYVSAEVDHPYKEGREGV